VSPEPPEAGGEPRVAFGPDDPVPPEKREGVPEVAEEAPGRQERGPEEKPDVEEKPEEKGVEVAQEERPHEERKPSEIKFDLTGDPSTGRIYFVQLGAYRNEVQARNLEGAYSSNYPIAVYSAPSGSRSMYRVLVGPLNKDESGAVLHWFKARGFQDAFVRSAN
jgi:cell division septation protein DedD